MNPETGPGDTLGTAESLDSDEVRNDDGDVAVTPPDHWQAADRDDMTERGQRLGESHAERLAEEEPDVSADDPAAPEMPSGAAGLEPEERPARRHRGQIDGTPEDGDSFFTETP
ncbi:hypothetical protein D7D52_32275 [Nocardia yunnanensis]|uniref:DUF5709 domain-containing protein n=1 Tax=Nocardia yunnanensis TaxID=2382165 RepID=A0A386ZJG2_9NOCA|nr:hypothetical protein [Nocardia yunnanensis]AYF77717.1 hypothetical protein D7D52_32275 [Nocardia yunnanensis]